MHTKYVYLFLAKLRGFLSYQNKIIVYTSNLYAQNFILKSILIYFTFGLPDNI